MYLRIEGGGGGGSDGATECGLLESGGKGTER